MNRRASRGERSMPMNQLTQGEVSSSGRLVPWTSQPNRRDAYGVIHSGLDHLFSLHRNGDWGAHSGSETTWTTAYVLARLAELPGKLLSHSRLQDIKNSLDWLLQVQDNGMWRESNEPDCLTTALAVITLRAYGRNIPMGALSFLDACRTEDGSFASFPGKERATDRCTALAITATACKALEWVHPQTEEFLSRWMRCALPIQGEPSLAGPYVCSEILDWPSGLASMAVLNKASQLTCQVDPDNAYGQALLLRSLLELRISRSWAVAARLREMQTQDGSWGQTRRPDKRQFDAATALTCSANEAVTSVTVISALVMAESQPGLYFGSDLPLPQRF